MRKKKEYSDDIFFTLLKGYNRPAISHKKISRIIDDYYSSSDNKVIIKSERFRRPVITIAAAASVFLVLFVTGFLSLSLNRELNYPLIVTGTQESETVRVIDKPIAFNTSETGYVVFQTDSERIKVFPSSELRVKQDIFSALNKQRDNIYNLKTGKILVNHDTSGAKDHFQLKTPFGRLEILGTLFILEVKESGLSIVCKEGEILFYPDIGKEAIQINENEKLNFVIKGNNIIERTVQKIETNEIEQLFKKDEAERYFIQPDIDLKRQLNTFILSTDVPDGEIWINGNFVGAGTGKYIFSGKDELLVEIKRAGFLVKRLYVPVEGKDTSIELKLKKDSSREEGIQEEAPKDEPKDKPLIEEKPADSPMSAKTEPVVKPEAEEKLTLLWERTIDISDVDIPVKLGAGDQYIIVSGKNSLRWINKLDGEEVGQYIVKSEIIEYVLDGNIVYLYTPGKVTAFDLTDSSNLWETLVGSMAYTGFSAGKDYIFVPSTDGSLYILDKQNGKLFFKIETETGLYGLPLQVNDSIIFSSFSSEVYSFSLNTTGLNWKYKALNKFINDRPYYIEKTDSVITSDVEGIIYCLNRLNGDELFIYDNGKPFEFPPLSLNENIYFADNTGIKSLSLNGGLLFSIDKPVKLLDIFTLNNSNIYAVFEDGIYLLRDNLDVEQQASFQIMAADYDSDYNKNSLYVITEEKKLIKYALSGR